MKKRKHTRRNGPHPVWAGIGTVLGIGIGGRVVRALAPASSQTAVGLAYAIGVPAAAYFGADRISRPNAGGIRVGAIISFLLNAADAAYAYAAKSSSSSLPAITPPNAAAQAAALPAYSGYTVLATVGQRYVAELSPSAPTPIAVISSNPAVASLQSDGTMLIVGKGTTMLTGPGFSSQVQVN